MISVSELKRNFIQILDGFPQEVINLPEDVLRAKPGSNKWSKIEILGHLVDSGLNNHQRIIRVLQGTPITIHYDQDKWVAKQDYQHTPAEDVLQLWILINKQLYRLIEKISPEELTFPYFDGQRELSLSYLLEDYLRHIGHHRNQLSM